MKFIILLFFVTGIYSQKDPYFLTKFYFEDALGNKKDIEIGYDTLADDCKVNSIFGEILDLSPFDSIFDIRSANIFSWGGFSSCSVPKKFIYSKRIVGGAERIISNSFCIGGAELIFFIHAKYQPITIRWSAKDFEQINCKNKNWSFFTPDFTHNLVFNHEWIAHNPKYACIREETYTFFIGSQYVLLGERPYILKHEIMGKGMDSIYGMSFNNDQTFFYCDESYVGLKETKGSSEELSVYPNPVTSRINIVVRSEFVAERIRIYHLSGIEQEVNCVNEHNGERIEIDVSEFVSGIYIVEFMNRHGDKKIQRFIKI